MPETLAIIDGHYYAYRFFFAMPPQTGPGGRPTGVLTAFANLFRDLRANAAITHWVCVFDVDTTFRHQLDPNYKAHRDPTPEILARQIGDMDALCAASGIPVVRALGFEADDVLFTYARQAERADFDVRLLTRDKDVDQCLSARVRTWDIGKNELRGPPELLAEKGLTPAQVVDYLSMIGDTSDNVPGITGVGPKNAAKLLTQYGTLANVLAHVDELKGKQQENVRAFIPRAEHTRQLITLVDVPDLPALDTFRIDRNFVGDEAVYATFGFNRARYFATPPKAASADPSGYRTLTADALPQLVADLRRAGRFAIDTETTGLDPLLAELVGISIAWGEHGGRGAVYLPIQGLAEERHQPLPLDLVRSELGPLLADATVAKFGQNLKYDARILTHHGLTVAGWNGDTMLASWLLDPARESHGLDHLARTFLGEEKIATHQVVDLAAGQTMAQVPIAQVATYACEDAQCTWRLAQILEAKLAENQLLEVYRTQEVPIAACLARLEQAGIGVDATILATSKANLEQYLDQVMVGIRAQAGPQFNPNSPKQIAELLFTKLKLPVISSTKSGPSTDASVLEALRHLHELPDLLLQHRSLSKLIGTYLARLPDYISSVDGRIHSHFKQTGTETGRLSSDEPNLQNIPKKSNLGREIRAAFVPASGHVFIAADYSQIELRILAHLSGDPTLKAAFAANTDIHRFVAAQVNSVDAAAVTPAQRNAAKAINFGIIYGQSAFGLSQQLGIPRGQAQRFIDDYFARFSEVQRYVALVVADAAAKGYAETMAGRRRYIPMLGSGNRNERLQGERIALNSTIQGSAADLIKRAMLRCERTLPNGARLILQIHDELVVEAPDALVTAAADALRTAMTGAWELTVPLIAETRQGRSWFDVS